MIIGGRPDAFEAASFYEFGSAVSSLYEETFTAAAFVAFTAPALAQAHLCEGRFTLASVDDSKSKTHDDVVIGVDGKPMTFAIVANCPKDPTVKMVKVGSLGQALIRFTVDSLTTETDFSKIGSIDDLSSIFDPGQNVIASSVTGQFKDTGETIVLTGEITNAGGKAGREKHAFIFSDIRETVETSCTAAEMTVEVMEKDASNDTDMICHYNRQ